MYGYNKHAHVSIHIYIHMYVRVYIYIYTYIYIHLHISIDIGIKQNPTTALGAQGASSFPTDLESLARRLIIHPIHHRAGLGTGCWATSEIQFVPTVAVWPTLCVNVFSCIHVCIYATYIYIYIEIRAYVYIYIYPHVYVYMCMCII